MPRKNCSKTPAFPGISVSRSWASCNYKNNTFPRPVHTLGSLFFLSFATHPTISLPRGWSLQGLPDCPSSTDGARALSVSEEKTRMCWALPLFRALRLARGTLTQVICSTGKARTHCTPVPLPQHHVTPCLLPAQHAETQTHLSTPQATRFLLREVAGSETLGLRYRNTDEGQQRINRE